MFSTILPFVGAELFASYFANDAELVTPTPLLTKAQLQEIDDKGWMNDSYIEHHEVSKHNGKVIYDVIYKHDRFGRRILPINPKADKFALFLGGSNTFGQGLNIKKTLAFKFQKKQPQYQSYLYAQKGFGPSHALAQVEFEGFSSGVSQSRGIAFYFYLPFHIYRTYYNTITLQWNGGMIPLYEEQNDRVLRAENWLSEISKNIIWQLSKSKFIQSNRIILPPVTSSRIKTACRILEKTHKNIVDKLGETLFIIVSVDTDELEKACVKNRKDFRSIKIDTRYSGSNRWNQHQYTFESDGHWREKMVDFIIQEVDTQLSLDSGGVKL